MSFKQLTTIAALMGASNAAGGGFDYNTDNGGVGAGSDWASIVYTDDTDANGDPKPVTVNECAESNQSPIALFSKGQPGFDYPVYESTKDNIKKSYTNQYDTEVKNTGDTTKVTLATDSTTENGQEVHVTNWFESDIANEIFGSVNKRWEGAQFHLHSGSEHTIDGVRHDLEMHTVHLPPAGVTPEEGFFASAMGLVFSVNDYTADLTFAEQQVIDIFFESMKWTVNGPTVDLVAYGSLMEMVDFNNRWVYKGSVTTPPCARFVYWNVLSTIYPVSQTQLDNFKARLEEGTTGLRAAGNWRAIQPVNDHKVIYVQKGLATYLEEIAEGTDDSKKGLVAATVIFALIAFFALIGCAVFGYQANSKGEAAPSKAEAADQEQEMAAQPKAAEE